MFDDNDLDLSMPPLEVPELKLEFAFRIKILFKDRHFFTGPKGRRAFVQPFGGVVEGPLLNGKVVPLSGADWAQNGQLNAHYMLEADDGTLIYLNNLGYLYRTDGEVTDPKNPLWSKDVPSYFRLTPYFDCPTGPHDWLTRHVVVGTGQRHDDPDHTMFHYWVVR
ncbi:DUF3237 domain-containing protein [Maritimibacter sp. DP1N21-5]|uniref:DUF3237 domain-containing protein n=1 Tax=Maritimibacter sp. DP1N21-5 TaxID=2836867 RepID=UPI001C4620AF|nr:DUF3237 domain-containing protein [Maritimibacter sp. DP1N21-5]MBV7411112.1 DUF3237 domain-containing protein [Maritimibacter sp. DP1N21-5]